MRIDDAEQTLIRVSFQRLKCRPEALSLDFYERLFAAAPHLRRLFGEDMLRQAHKLSALLVHVVETCDRLETLAGPLHDLGRFHAGKGVEGRHYAVVRAALLDALEDNVTGWTAAHAAAWGRVYDIAATAMLHGAASGGIEGTDPAPRSATA
ncbi:globin domain-containing protein [Wenxinia saemankumensis]|uniref:Hemoglobin-like flavoprotein n=1 Tax=Wenxinia saemankumensis TaxID=1447782 RepID=A0A1M6ENH3_9RHOB|nr:globin domain-containing protein [Wenxinia saemankumensis]SHI86984.1 Hemoglobin-like flavoprotein [Wenxinia saemankumensis]